MARKGKGKPERFIKKFKTGATVVFTQQSKHYLTCETSTESTNRPRQITNKKNCSSPEMTESFLYLVDLKPLTTIIPPLCLLTVPRPSVFTASSSLLFSFYRRITVMNTGTAHRSCQTMFTSMHYSMTSPYCIQPVNTMRNKTPHMYKTLR